MRIGILVLVGVAAVAAILGWYQYSADQTRQQGFVFGNELQQIQNDLKELQTQFYASITSWEEGEIDRDELLFRLHAHLNDFEEIMPRYDDLSPPDDFAAAVELFKLSSQAQMESDSQYVEWISTGSESAKMRSDLQLKESFDLEIAALAEYNRAQSGAPQQ